MKLLPGKLPPVMLQRLLRFTGAHDPLVLIGPRFGEDAAVIQLGNLCLVVKSDPITFTAQEIGWYAVHVNANDVAVMGVRPRWFQTTLIVPPGTDSATVAGVFRDVDRAARSLGIAVTGGHSEISAAVTQPILAGNMQGIGKRSSLVTSDGARTGDVVILTKWAGIEGTSILARERATSCRKVLGTRGQKAAADFHRHPGISVVVEALAAARLGATAMHDPTEGGVAAALYELASASRRCLEIDLDLIPIHPLTSRLCSHFRIDPKALIASGSLLVAIPSARAARLLSRLKLQGIPATVIGRFRSGRGVRARSGGKAASLAWPERDELARLSSGAAVLRRPLEAARKES
jgi:hydrogenase expression/formation protein HypE